jgi:hypothetical protein
MPVRYQYITRLDNKKMVTARLNLNGSSSDSLCTYACVMRVRALCVCVRCEGACVLEGACVVRVRAFWRVRVRASCGSVRCVLKTSDNTGVSAGYGGRRVIQNDTKKITSHSPADGQLFQHPQPHPPHTPTHLYSPSLTPSQTHPRTRQYLLPNPPPLPLSPHALSRFPPKAHRPTV